GAVNNRPDNFYYFGLPGVNSITLGGNSVFVGAIYAPNASLTLNGGGGNNGLDGAAIVASVTLNGHYDFHYDTSLATNQFSRGVIPISWQEL
ncbi:MAG TPA: collagen-binding domain-containing protein, partial [Candidatus Acidoferrum sp.]|nr:collagen-binding domain-containing protein [Candidatus Acidoferrum sp.]